MKKLHFLFFALFIFPAMAHAIVIRPDVPDSSYQISDSVFPALVDLPGEGHGTLIAPQWVVTSAHSTQGYMLHQVWLGGKWRDVARVVLYPGFKEEFASVKVAAENPTLENWPLLKSAFRSMHDVALIELVEPVVDVKPVTLYRASDEQGKVVKIIGKGATGNGNVGQFEGTSHRGELRHAFNQIIYAHEQWLDYQFDCDAKALPLEGVLGDGDSGGPLLIESEGELKLAGIADWKHWPKGRTEFIAGICNQAFSYSRVSHYAKWIDGVIGLQPNQ